MKRPSVGQAIEAAHRFLADLRETEFKGPVPDEPFTMFSSPSGASVFLQGDEAAQFYRTALLLTEAVPKTIKLSRRAVTGRLQNAVLHVLDPANEFPSESRAARITAAIKALRNELTAEPKSWKYAIPVYGLDPSSLPATFGGVRFRRTSAQYYVSLRRAAGVTYGRDWAKYVGPVVGELAVAAVDSGAAIAEARSLLGQHLDVLNFFAPLCAYDAGWAYLSGEAEPGKESYLLIGYDGTPKFAPGGGDRGPSHLLDMRRLRQANARRAGAPRASKIMASNKRSAFEERLITAMQWAGRARSASRADASFLFRLIALESLLVGRGQAGEIGYRLRIRAAQLLGKSRAGRVEVARRVKTLYGLRSALVHDGQAELPDRMQQWAKGLVANAIAVVLAKTELRTLKDEEALEAWFDERALG